ncbi:MAG TPA: hypothetical protein VD837_01160 [Terriglobales bacterium]|nr:hypothetical protein [Terriglobales bacterium]
MSRRNVVRHKMAVPVKLLITEPDGSVRTLLACTLDASNTGVRLGGIHETLNVGQVVVLQYQHRRSQFLVKWVGRRGTGSSTQIGLQCLEPAKNIWGVEMSDRIPPSSASRQQLRYAVGLGSL